MPSSVSTSSDLHVLAKSLAALDASQSLLTSSGATDGQANHHHGLSTEAMCSVLQLPQTAASRSENSSLSSPSIMVFDAHRATTTHASPFDHSGAHDTSQRRERIVSELRTIVGLLNTQMSGPPTCDEWGRDTPRHIDVNSQSGPVSVAAVVPPSLPFSMERLLVENATALQKELLCLHPGRPHGASQTNNTSRDGQKRGRLSLSAVSECMAHYLQQVESKKSLDVRGAAVNRRESADNVRFSFASSSSGSVTAPLASSFPAALPSQEESIASYRRLVRELMQQQDYGRTPAHHYFGLLSRRPSFVSSAWERAMDGRQEDSSTTWGGGGQHWSTTDPLGHNHSSRAFPFYHQYEPRGSFPEAAQYPTLGHSSRGSSVASPAASPRQQMHGAQREGRGGSAEPTNPLKKHDVPGGHVWPPSDDDDGRRSNPFLPCVRQLYRWNHEIVLQERLRARAVDETATVPSAVADPPVLPNKCTLPPEHIAADDSKPPTAAGDNYSDDALASRLDAFDHSSTRSGHDASGPTPLSSSQLVDTPMESVFVEEVRVASHAFGLLDGAEDELLFGEGGSSSSRSSPLRAGRTTATLAREGKHVPQRLFFPLAATMLHSLDHAPPARPHITRVSPPAAVHLLRPPRGGQRQSSAHVGLLHPRLLDNVAHYCWFTALCYPHHPLRKCLAWFVEKRLDYVQCCMRTAGIRIGTENGANGGEEKGDDDNNSIRASFDLEEEGENGTDSFCVDENEPPLPVGVGRRGRQGHFRFRNVRQLWDTDRIAFTAALSETFAEKMFVARSIPVTMDLPDPWTALSPLTSSFAAAAACASVMASERDQVLARRHQRNDLFFRHILDGNGGRAQQPASEGEHAATSNSLRSSISARLASFRSSVTRRGLVTDRRPGSKSRSPSPVVPDHGRSRQLSIHSIGSSVDSSPAGAGPPLSATTVLLNDEEDVHAVSGSAAVAGTHAVCSLSVAIGPIFREVVPASIEGFLFWLVLDAVLSLHFGSRERRDATVSACAHALETSSSCAALPAVSAAARSSPPLKLVLTCSNGLRLYALLPVDVRGLSTLCVTDSGLSMLAGLSVELDRFVHAWITRVLDYTSTARPGSASSAPSHSPSPSSSSSPQAAPPPPWVDPDVDTRRLVSFLQHTFQVVEHVATYSTMEYHPPPVEGRSSNDNGGSDESGGELDGASKNGFDEEPRMFAGKHQSPEAVGADVLLPVAVTFCSMLHFQSILLPVLQWIDGSVLYASPVGGKGSSAYTYMTFIAALSAAAGGSTETSCDENKN